MCVADYKIIAKEGIAYRCDHSRADDNIINKLMDNINNLQEQLQNLERGLKQLLRL